MLSEADIDEGCLREVRLVLARARCRPGYGQDLIAKAKDLAAGEAVIRSVKPADQVVKIVYDGLVEMLGGDTPSTLNISLNPPTGILMAGLQGSARPRPAPSWVCA